MRTLAHIYTILLQQPGVVQNFKSALDLFTRENFAQLRTAIDNYTTDEKDALKPGLKQNLYYLLKRSAKILRALMLSENKQDIANIIQGFKDLLELWDDIIFGDAVYETNIRREIFLRKPEQLPIEEDMMMIKNHIIARIETLTRDQFNFFSAKEFVELRDVAVSRLVIINGRRDGEPSRLAISDWIAAKNDTWINKENLSFLDDFDMALVNSLKVTYITGKGKYK